jgi:hypothetical protein
MRLVPELLQLGGISWVWEKRFFRHGNGPAARSD